MKKIIAWTLLMTGMTGASLAAARLNEDASVWDLLKDIFFWLGMLAVAASIFLNKTDRGPTPLQTEVDSNVSTQMRDWISEILSRISQIDRNASLSARVVELTSIQENLIFLVTDAKDRLIALKGFAFYARFMSDFAVAERFLARAWSSAVDGYPDESDTYIEKAATFFAHANAILEEN